MSTPDTQTRILRALEAATTRLEEEVRRRTEPIAIVGMGCRYPGGADDPERFWNLLSSGGDATGDYPRERWNIDELFDADPDARGKSAVRRGGFLDHVDLFDAEFFGITPREAASMDPQQRLLLETAWEAFERAGLTRAALRGTRTGVFVGITNCDYGRALAASLSRLDAYYVTGNTLNAAAGRIAYLLGLRGPALAVDTACSSSLVAVHLACQSLRTRECDAAVAAGVNLILTAEGLVALSRSRVLSPDGRCRTFDASANGMGRGEGCGVLILKRLSDAEQSGDAVLALIAGSAVNQDGASSGLTVPNGIAQTDVILDAIAAARMTPDEIDYVEAHGTGTALGDPIELNALARAFGRGPGAPPLIVGSVKANIAHAESASGIAGLIKAVLALQHRVIPPQIHLDVLTPHVDWPGAGLDVPTAARAWPETGRPAAAGVSSFGFSGTNAHIVLREAPRASQPAPPAEDGPCVLPLSAATPEALRAVAARYVAVLEDGAGLTDAAFSAATSRDHHAVRAAIVATSADEARASLARLAAGRSDGILTGSGRARPGIVFLFAGQGTQATGMGRALYDREPAFRAAVDECTSILGADFLFGAGEGIDDTAVAQPALFVFEYALASLWRSWGIEPAAVIGHSVGEYVAACLAGVFSLNDALRLVTARGELMSALPRIGGMAAVFAPEEDVREAIANLAVRVSIAAVNAPGNVVLSGENDALHGALAALNSRGIASTPLQVSHAFHSDLMTPMLVGFRRVLSTVTFHPPTLPLYSNADGTRRDDEMASADYWMSHVLRTVRFSAAVRCAIADGHSALLEIGPHSTLTAFVRAHDTAVTSVASLARGERDDLRVRQALAALYVAGAGIDWRGVFAGRPARRIPLPTYPFQRRRHWFEEAAAAAPLFTVQWHPRALPLPPAGDVEILTDAGDAARVATLDDQRPVAFAAPATRAGAGLDERPYVDTLRVIQAFAVGKRRLWIVTSRGVDVADSGADPSQAAVWGLTRTAQLEIPQQVAGLIDAPGALDPLALASAIASGAGECALRDGRLHVPVLGPAPSSDSRLTLPADGSFVVTGGFGGLGIAAAEWLAARGARALVLCGRRPAAADVEARIAALRGRGVTLECVLGDVSRRAEAAEIVALARSVGRLRGVVHCAGSVADGFLDAQTPERFASVAAGKVEGAIHLDVLTRGLELDWFVLFSSLSAALGSPGQGNYAAANAAIEAVAVERRRAGEPAVAVAWGPWAEAGMAARLKASEREAMASRGLAPMTAEAALRALEAVLTGAASHAVVAQINAAAVRGAFPASRLQLLDALAPPDMPAPQATAPLDRAAAVGYLRQRVAGLLGLSAEAIQAARSLQEQGLDSMMAMELRNHVRRDHGIDVPVSRLLGGATIDRVAPLLVSAAPGPETEEFVL